MVDHIYDNFAKELADIRTWEPEFDDFAAYIERKGGLFNNIIGFIDGHFQFVCRPGGRRNVNRSVRQR
eukprot:1463602-Rhodomonas_salina.1